MISIFKSLRKPVGAVILMLSIVLIPVFSGLSIQADAAEIYQAYTKSGEYPASDHLKNPIYVRPQGSNDKVM